MMAVVSASGNSLTFLYDSDPVMVSNQLSVTSVTVKFVFDFKLEDILREIQTAKDAYAKFSALKLWTDADLKKQFAKSLGEANVSFQEASECLGQILILTKGTSNFKQNLQCQYTHPTPSIASLNESLKTIEVTATNVGSDWNPDEFKTDKQKQLILEAFINTYRDVASQWEVNFCGLLAMVDTLNGLEFPQVLKGIVEQLDCLKLTKNEEIIVQNCVSSEKEFTCHLLFDQPIDTKEVIPLIPLVYTVNSIGYGLKLDYPEKQQFVKEKSTGQIKIMECPHLTDLESQQSPQCVFATPVLFLETCLKGLQMDDVATILTHCRFKGYNGQSFKQMGDGGILIQNQSIIVKEGEKLLYNQKPFVIYTLQKLSLTLSGEEFIFPPRSDSVQKIETTRLTQLEIERIAAFGSSTDFWDNFDISEWTDYIGFVVDLILTPLVLLALGLACKRIRRVKAKAKANKKEEKANYRKNRRLLNTTEL